VKVKSWDELLKLSSSSGFIIPADELKDHNCVRELRSLCHSQQQKLAELKTEITDQNLTINELKRELNLIKDFMRAMRVSNPAMRAIADQMERDEVLRWSNSLPRARVTRWGGMISTPDDSLQVENSRNFEAKIIKLFSR
jgi:E3 ubiquitin-protein ligase NRDP1